MKSTIKIFFALASLLILFTCTCYAQTELMGEQTRGSGTDATLKCEGIQIGTAMTIVNVSGLNAGFWITETPEGTALAKFDNMKQGIGVKLNPGTYYVYPNLIENKGVAYITLFLK